LEMASELAQRSVLQVEEEGVARSPDGRLRSDRERQRSDGSLRAEPHQVRRAQIQNSLWPTLAGKKMDPPRAVRRLGDGDPAAGEEGPRGRVPAGVAEDRDEPAVRRIEEREAAPSFPDDHASRAIVEGQ